MKIPFFLVVTVLGLSVLPASAAQVLSIGDGDTITVKGSGGNTKVRLACIDAPETSQRPYGQQSRQKLRALLPVGSEVTIRFKATDRYGRTVGEVLKGGTNINQAMVGSGQAFVYWDYIKGCDRGTYSSLENQARINGVGVWAVTDGIQRPWEYRRAGRGGSGGSSQPSGQSRRRWRCKDVDSWAHAQQLLKEGHGYLDRDKDGEACEGRR